MALAPDALPARRRPLPRRAVLLLVHALLALPGTVLALVLALTGNASAAGRLQRRLASLGGPAESPSATPLPPEPDRFRTVVGRALRGLPANTLAFALAAPSVTLLLVRGLLYPLATAGEDTTNAWGGPTPAGAWAAHFAIALAMVAAVATLLATTRRPHRW
ncbi:hypothetical protein [Streptomyces sp. CB02460]|uniref:hypothetical protein n=1 Tax=Streptomyces sp. CB02460 TaxID=1703941 RepID=UPI00093CC67E|nr:hypothetical protein [Streptomyces sp. CB02460]OKJ68577.1 hypothetical protein AMK30_29415 [Streptomyces sp. CB02460]